MVTSNLLKVIAAFAGGVVVALGSALIYVRVSDAVHPLPVAPHISETAVAPLPAGGQEASDSEAPVQPASATEDKQQNPESQKVAAKARKVVPASVPHRTRKASPAPAYPKLDQQAPATTQVAQNSAPPPVPRSIPSYPPVAVNEPTPEPPAPASADRQSAPQLSDAPQVAAPPQPHVVTLQAGTNLNVRLDETLSTDHNYTGDTFRATLQDPIIVDGFIIADKGSKVLGRIVEAHKPGRVEGTANLNLTLTEINTTDGQRVHVETNSVEKKGVRSTGEDTAKIAGGAALGAIIGAIAGGGKGAAIGASVGGAAGTGTVLMTRGKAATLPIESRLTFQLSDPITITEKLN